MGATHASRGWPWMATQGLREAGTAQRNGFTAFPEMPPPIETLLPIGEKRNRNSQ